MDSPIKTLNFNRFCHIGKLSKQFFFEKLQIKKQTQNLLIITKLFL